MLNLVWVFMNQFEIMFLLDFFFFFYFFLPVPSILHVYVIWT